VGVSFWVGGEEMRGGQGREGRDGGREMGHEIKGRAYEKAPAWRAGTPPDRAPGGGQLGVLGRALALELELRVVRRGCDVKMRRGW
jgi:hypothetical protein